jgi:hypothetical protein
MKRFHDDVGELAGLMERAKNADLSSVVDEGNTTCCYARSEKHWVTDPQGIAWEQFHTLGSIPLFNDSVQASVEALDDASDDAKSIVQIEATSTSKACCG